MAANVLNSPQAVQMSVYDVRAFVKKGLEANPDALICNDQEPMLSDQ